VRFLAPAALAGLVLTLGAPGGAISAGALSGTPYAGFVRTAIDGNATFPDVAATARDNRFVILQSWKQDLARQLKAANPDVKVLAYKNLSFVSCDEHSNQEHVPQGVRCADVNANHPEWFLTDAAGDRLRPAGYPWLWLLDVGNPAYQDAWADGVITEARADGWDGVFLDDVNPTVRYHLDPARVARYPSDSAWGAATQSMLERVGPRIRAAGLLAIANVCCARDHGTVWRDWLPSLSGAMDEMFTKWGNDPASGFVWDWGAGGWSAQLEEVREAEAQGKYFLGIAHSRATDARAAAYGLGTMLLASQGRSSFALAQDYTSETRFPVYKRASQLGAPAGAYFRVGAAYRRNFAGGTVVVNPSRSPVTVALGGEYLGKTGTPVRTVTLGPTTAAILLTAGRGAGFRFTSGVAEARASAGSVRRVRVRLSGRVLARASGRSVARVTLYRRTARGWRPLARVRTSARGRFRVERRVRTSARALRLRAVGVSSGLTVRSRVVVVGVRVRH
jgi:Hypothetical glycosyl hydrolase family 15